MLGGRPVTTMFRARHGVEFCLYCSEHSRLKLFFSFGGLVVDLISAVDLVDCNACAYDSLTRLIDDEVKSVADISSFVTARFPFEADEVISGRLLVRNSS